MQTESVSHDSPAYAALLTRIQKEAVGLCPTDTVYGICCRADSSSGTSRIFEIKGRETAKTLPVLIGCWEQFVRIAEPVDASLMERVRALWPGGLTVVVRASVEGRKLSPHCLREGTLAVRMPDHEVLRHLIRDLGVPLAATSANPSGKPECLSVEEIDPSIRQAVDWEWNERIDREEVRPSTVVDLLHHPPRVLRQGAVLFREETEA